MTYIDDKNGPTNSDPICIVYVQGVAPTTSITTHVQNDHLVQK